MLNFAISVKTSESLGYSWLKEISYVKDGIVHNNLYAFHKYTSAHILYVHLHAVHIDVTRLLNGKNNMRSTHLRLNLLVDLPMYSFQQFHYSSFRVC